MRAAAPRPPAVVPSLLARLASLGWRVLVSLALAVAIGFVLAELASVTASLIVGLIAASILLPLVRRLRARGLSAGPSAAIACAVGLVILILAVLLLGLALVPNLREITAAVREGVDDLRAQLASIGVPAFVSQAVDDLVESFVTVDMAALVGSVVSVATVLILGGFLTIFLLADGDRGWGALMGALDRRQATVLTDSAESGLERVGAYLRRTALLALVDALAVGLVLVAFGIPLAGALVVATFVLGFVPYLGAVVTGIVIGLVVDASAGPAAAIFALIVFVAAGLVGQRAIAGTSIGTRVDVHPVLVLAAIPAGAALFGVLGIVALLPVTVFLIAVSKSIVVALSLEPTRGASAAPPEGVPLWLDRLAQWSWRALIVIGLVAVVIAVVVRVPVVVVPAVLATVLAATLAPATARLRALGWSPGRAAFVAISAATVLIGIAFVVSIVWTAGPLSDIVATSVEGASEADIAWLADLVDRFGSELIIDLRGVLRGLAVLALNLVLALLLAYFFLRDAPAWWSRRLDGVGGSRRTHLAAAGTEAVSVLGGYITGTAIISLFGAVTSAIIMVVLGLPLAVPVGIFTFFGGFIPYLGSALSTAMATLIAVAVGTPTDVIVMLVYTVIFNIVQGNFVTPLVYGRTFSLHPAIILLAIPAGYEIAGILGMFLVIPFVAIVAATWRAVLNTISLEEEAPLPGPPQPMPRPATAEG
jgi:putative heme transporter